MKREEIAKWRNELAAVVRNGRALGGYDVNALRILLLEEFALAVAEHLTEKEKERK